MKCFWLFGNGVSHTIQTEKKQAKEGECCLIRKVRKKKKKKREMYNWSIVQTRKDRKGVIVQNNRAEKVSGMDCTEQGGMRGGYSTDRCQDI